MAKSDNGELNNSNLASNNSDPNNSLLQKVTKRVSGLFPSSITKWFGPSDGSQAVIRRRESIEDDDEQLQIQQPPKKRAKPTTDVEFSTSNHFQMTSTPLINSRQLQAGPSGYTRHTISSALYDGGASTSARRPPEGTETYQRTRPDPVLNGDDKSDSGDSTSGYSSVLAQQHKESCFVSDRGHAMNRPSTSKTSPSPSPNKSLNTSLNSSRSLFSDQSLNPQRQCLSARRPSFNSSTFGSPTFMDRTLSTKRAVNSPFYGGRTIYGGASAYKRNRIIFPRDEANQLQVKNSINIKPVNDAATTSRNDHVSLSKTARRILDTLEHFSTPVLDAKKIPNINRTTQRLTPYSRERETSIKSPPNRELIIPSVPDLLKMKQKERLQNSTVQVRKVATTSKSVLNTEYSIRTLEDESTKPQKHTNKIKAKIATVRDKKDKVQDTVDAVQLPEVKLPITSLPKFDFALPLPPAPIIKPPAAETTKPKEFTVKTPKSNGPPQEYTFAKPIIVINNSDVIPKSMNSIRNNFKFSDPIDAKTSTITNTTHAITFKITENNTGPRKKDQTKNNGQNDVGFSLQPPKQLLEGSVMDILGKKPESNLMEKFKPAVGTWECLSCMVRNVPSATRCVACETLKEPVKKVEQQPSSGFGNQFKMSTEKWECSACMVRNNNTDVKCVACTTPKPSLNSVPVEKTTTKPVLNSFGDKFKPASDTWECGACMIRNKNDAVKCAACETLKPGAAKEAKPSLIMPVAAGAATNTTGFTDFIKKQQTNWECPSCMVRNPPEKKTCACCEGPKPGEKQEFNFGAKPSTQFKFGIDKAAAAATATTTGSVGTSGFTFGATNSSPSTFSFGVKPVATDAKPTGFTFGVQSATTKSTESQTSVPVASTVTETDTNKSTAIAAPSNNIVLNGEPKKMFAFGTSTQSTTVTSSTNNKTTSVVTSSNIFGVTPAAAAAAVTAPRSTVPAPSTESSGGVSSTSTSTTTSAASNTFSFGTTNPKPDTFGADKKPDVVPTPQFNFGSSSLPFNPVFATTKTATGTTFTPGMNLLNPTPTPSSVPSEPSSLGFGGKSHPSAAFSFKTNANINNNNNNNKNEVKPFSFGATTTKTTDPSTAGKVPEFTFAPKTEQTTKAPVMNFAATDAPQKTPNSMFSFGAKTDTKAPPTSFGGGGGGGSTMFGQNDQSTAMPQNGGFNFGATAVTPNFNFGAGAASSSTPTVFGFGSSQAGSGSATAAAPVASAPGVFTFGGGTPAQQPTTAAFTPEIKPTFNFTGGAPVPAFTAQGGPSATMPQRKIRKAVRRTQPR